MQLLNLEDKVTQDFMNAFFNNVNDITSELFIIFKELKSSFSQLALRKTQNYFYASIDLLRMCELFATCCPELFLDIEHVHSSRLLNFVMLVLNTVLTGDVSKHISHFADRMQLTSASLQQFLAPLIGIFVSLYSCILKQRLTLEESRKMNPRARQKYDDLAELFAKGNVFSWQGL